MFEFQKYIYFSEAIDSFINYKTVTKLNHRVQYLKHILYISTKDKHVDKKRIAQRVK